MKPRACSKPGAAARPIAAGPTPDSAGLRVSWRWAILQRATACADLEASKLPGRSGLAGAPDRPRWAAKRPQVI